MKFQRRFANNFSFLNSYTFGKAIDFELRQRRRGHADQRLRPAVQPRAVRLRHHAHVHVERGSTSCRGRKDKLYGGWQVSGILLPPRRPAADHHADARACSRPATGNRPNRICDGRLDNPTIDDWFDTSCFVPADGHHGHLRRLRPRHHPRARVVQHRRVAHQEHAIGRVHDRVPHRGVQPPEPPAVRATRTRPFGNAAVRHDLGDAVEPVVLALRHDRAAGAAGREGPFLSHGFHGTHGTGSIRLFTGAGHSWPAPFLFSDRRGLDRPRIVN